MTGRTSTLGTGVFAMHDFLVNDELMWFRNGRTSALRKHIKATRVRATCGSFGCCWYDVLKWKKWRNILNSVVKSSWRQFLLFLFLFWPSLSLLVTPRLYRSIKSRIRHSAITLGVLATITKILVQTDTTIAVPQDTALYQPTNPVVTNGKVMYAARTRIIDSV